MLDKIDAWQVFWSLLTMLVSYIAIMITLFRKDLKELKTEVDKRMLIPMCEKYREGCRKDCERSREQRDKFIERIYHGAEEQCAEVKKELGRKAHVHASVGTAGEVIK